MSDFGHGWDSGPGGGAPDAAALRAMLALQAALGADEALGEAPVDRFAETARREAARAAPRAPAGAQGAAAAPAGPAVETAGRRRRPIRGLPKGAELPPPPPRAIVERPAEEVAAEIAASCATLDELRDAIAGFERSALKKGARSTVFADGFAGARVMVIGEAPGYDEDREGRPFVGRSGKLLDRMLGAIGLDRTALSAETGVRIANVIPWRPLENRTPADAEVAMMLPFLLRHIDLVDPQFLLLLGNVPTKALLSTSGGITRMRGKWGERDGRPALPSFHPAYLLRNPILKRESWRDLLSLRDALDGRRPGRS